MGKITGYSRVSHHTITGTGSTFAVPPSEDFTDGTWNAFGTELCLSEIGVSETDNKAYIRIGSNINEIKFNTGTAATEGLSDTLAVSNDSGTYSIIMGTATLISSINGGASIALDNYGLSKNIFISTDGIGMESSIEMTPSSFSINNSTGNLTLSASTYSISMSSNVEMSAGKVIKSLNGGGQIDLDYSTNPNNVLISSDNGGYGESFIDLQSSSINIGVDGGGTSNIQIDSTGIVSYGNAFTVASGNAFASAITGTIQLTSGTYSTYVQGLQFRKSSITNSSATSSTIATIPMVDGETITIEAKVNAVCTSPNRNYGARLMAVFLKYGGNIYQTSTTEIVAKDGFGDGTTCDIDTDGTNVRIRVTNGGGLTTRWVTTYDYLQSN